MFVLFLKGQSGPCALQKVQWKAVALTIPLFRDGQTSETDTIWDRRHRQNKDIEGTNKAYDEAAKSMPRSGVGDC